MNVSQAKAFMRQRLFAADISDAIVYNGVPINGHVNFGEGGDHANASRATIEVAREDVPAPAYRDAVVIDGVTWRVYRDDRTGDRIVGDAISWRIPVTRDERPMVMR